MAVPDNRTVHTGHFNTFRTVQNLQDGAVHTNVNVNRAKVGYGVCVHIYCDISEPLISRVLETKTDGKHGRNFLSKLGLQI